MRLKLNCKYRYKFKIVSMMGKTVHKSENKKKLLDIPVDIVEILSLQAEKERKSIKALMETILIDAAKAIKNNQ